MIVNEDLTPVVLVWPSCGKCGLAYALHRALSMSQGWMWLWSKDCKCRTTVAEAVIHDERVQS